MKMDVLNRYRDTQNSSSDDDSDSSNECEVWKRATNKKADTDEHALQNNGMDEEVISPNDAKDEIEQPLQLPEQPKPGQKRKRNTIWCDVLQDQLISEDLEDCLLKNKPAHFGSRGKESYDYRQAYKEAKDSDSEMSGHSLKDDSDTKSKKKHFFPTHKKFKKFVKLDTAELEAARKINKVLNEKKYYLIQRIVKYAGIEKAMHYLELTKQIEENGGMMIKNHSRRRTPGGVFIQMLKEDKDYVTKEMLDKVFEGEMSGFQSKKHFDEKRKKKKKNFMRKNEKQNQKEVSEVPTEVGIEGMEPEETVPMDAEEVTGEKPAASESDIFSSVKNLFSDPDFVGEASESLPAIEE